MLPLCIIVVQLDRNLSMQDTARALSLSPAIASSLIPCYACVTLGVGVAQ